MRVLGLILVGCLLVVTVLLLLRWRARNPAGKGAAPVVMMNPKELLFSLPTVENGFPDGEMAQPVPPEAFHLHEDDWRQVEFVGTPQRAAVELELQQLRSFIAEHRKGAFFSQAYLRRSRPDGLMPLAIETSALEPLLPRSVRRRPLVVGTPPWGPLLANGYAVEIGPDAVLYVEVVGRHLRTIGLPLAWRRGASPDADAVLASIGRTLSLRLVDWPAAAWVELE